MDQKKLNEYNISLSDSSAPQGSASSTTKNIEKGKGRNKSIEEEINFLTQLSMQVQEKNEKYKNLIEDKIRNNIGYQTIDDEFEYHFSEDNKIDKSKKNSNSINTKNCKKLEKISLILKNSAYHIYKLQLAQFAECIKRIYKNTKKNQYLITFDNTEEQIPSIILEQKDYMNLISIRDKYTNNDILSSFISKENCINPNSINKEKKNKSLTPNKNNNQFALNNSSKNKDNLNINKNISNYSSTLEEKKIGSNILFSYNICHQCKLQKIEEDLIKCQHIHTIPQSINTNNTSSSHNNKNNSNNTNNESPINYFFIGQSAIILTNKIYYLKNYDDSVKELVDNYFIHKLKEVNKKCEKYYCKNCLRSIYDIDINDIRKKNFRCPACSNRCNCSRCIRNENLIKQIAYYLNNYGDIDKLYDYLVKKNSIFEKLKDYLILGKFICVDFNTKNYVPLKLNIPQNSSIKNNEVDGGNKNNILNSLELIKYKNNLEKMQIDFCNIYDEANLKKQLYDTEFLKIKEGINKDIKENDKSDKNNKKFIGKKVKNPNSRKK